MLGQIATDAKSNKITAVPKLLRLLTLKGAIVTTDALNCQRAIAAQIVEQEGDYALALKENQPSLYEDVVLLLNDPEAVQSTMLPVVEADHGRIETRTATASTEVQWPNEQHQWPGLKAVGKVLRVRETPEAPKPPITCSARLLRRSASMRWRGSTGAWETACTGDWML